ncbi:MAG: DUF3127 domain-containing protein [Bacteroidales bacterium]|nr:DUF3127 domain-containing protein [Bacteroidales bacterium]
MKGGFVIMREGEYSKPVAFELFGDERLALLTGLSAGMPVKVNFIAVSFEGKNGGYYTTLRCTNVFPLVTGTATPVNQASTVAAANPTGVSAPQDQPNAELSPDEALPFDNDLPFF